MTTTATPCPAWCALGEHDELDARDAEDAGQTHGSLPVDEWVPDHDGHEPITVTIGGYRHAHKPLDDWPDSVIVDGNCSNVGYVGGVQVGAVDARRLGHALIAAANMIEETDQ